MKYEVEQKFPVEGFRAILVELTKLHAQFAEAHEETDVYFNHPARDFRQTDEAFRIRRRGGTSQITYKGPKIDDTTKTRRELELLLPEGKETVARWTELLEILGFRQVGRIHKRRRKFQVKWADCTVEGTLDELDELGSFVELELVVDAEQVDDARRTIGTLARKLGLTTSERRGYLQLLLSRS